MAKKWTCTFCQIVFESDWSKDCPSCSCDNDVEEAKDEKRCEQTKNMF